MPRMTNSRPRVFAQATLTNLAQAGLERPKDEAGITQALPVTLDNGYYSEAAVEALETLGCDPYIATVPLAAPCS